MRLTIPEIINGSWKEGFTTEWEIERDPNEYDKLLLTIQRSSIPRYIYDAMETYIMRTMAENYPEVNLAWV